MVKSQINQEWEVMSWLYLHAVHYIFLTFWFKVGGLVVYILPEEVDQSEIINKPARMKIDPTIASFASS